MDRRFLIAALISAGWTTQASAQSDLSKIVKAVTASKGGLTNSQADSGLREALSLGAAAAVSRVGKTDGYWGDSLIQIPLPNTLAKVQKTLKPLGLSSALDEVHLRVNRAAETAAPVARSLFIDAIKSLTVQDAVGIIKGGSTAGTQYLQKSTTPRLITLFTPPVQTALEQTGAVQSLDKAIKRNGLGNYIQKEPKVYLSDFAVGKALDGLFYYVGQEETAIRTNPAKRTSAILKAVFG
ncbi:DUF4197 domain-containing protein [Asticcacaulis sp. YBE204]|uniref:DUF4197 domain-containing protein n=1 Tax=Asticcacaulis sp. YBE204 TaxID=1282363 RepID=UPI0003C3D240|nr:DUF4197 domain-containing protein [Asticcacaulis sp. YBE204]ESQ77914.1 hypothetical protein AEYBE204_16695 [Asticcacaulis sp. YBE204]